MGRHGGRRNGFLDMARYKVKRYAGSEVSVESACRMCEDELKEMLWRDVWKEEIELKGVTWTYTMFEDGVIEVTGEI